MNCQLKKSPLTYAAAGAALLSAAATLCSNWATFGISSFSGIMLYTLFPVAAALLYAAVMLIPSCRNKPVRLILPATLGGIVLTCTESYLFLLTSQPEQFAAMWDYLCTDALALAVIIILVSLGLTASMVLLVLHILGIFRSDIAVLAVIGFSILCCIAEYVAGMILLQGSGFPWYMLSVLFFLTAELFTVPQLQMASSEGKDA